MTKSVIVLGSTGSIGTQTLEVCAALGIRVAAISGYRNTKLLSEQAARFSPEIATTEPLEALKCDADVVVNAIVGRAGLAATLETVGRGQRLALANKESLVCAGERVMALARDTGAEIIPVDSEHSAIFQCLRGADGNRVKRIILTASGGPFFGRTRGEMRGVTVAEALAHPNWRMGAKVTVDSATMMNKGLEMIEAMRLFGLPPERIRILVHRQSVVHSAVEFEDGAVIAQLGTPDMRLPIQYALTYPERRESPAAALELAEIGSLTFEEPDFEAFPCLRLAYEAVAGGDAACGALCDANERAVARFLAGEIGFDGIYESVSAELEKI
ncbi:MAG: 1-deoxy-D-xylulose-5-phosphate reductoisomerase [Oscillospiraceae bacterium]|jgi:1-deoxy-D-xylulose-5-phosphate reductoisomerase|nr:1-deoxy-D-xylulose-5-phosphate reductoisomerase [Oscillospiraceae bacterium]